MDTNRKTFLIGIVVIGLSAFIAFLLRPEPVDESVERVKIVERRPTPAAPNPTLSISGTVVDPLGAPISDARVWLLDEEAETRTDVEGVFTLEGIDHGPHQLVASAEGFVLPGPPEMHSRAVTLGRKTPLEGVELMLRRPGTIRGRVVAGGSPVDARISLFYLAAESLGDLTGPFSIDGVGETDDAGRFVINNVAPGRLRVLAEPEELALGESRVLDIQSGETVENIEIDILPGGGLTGTVGSSDGQMVSGAEVVVHSSELPRPRRTSTDGSGEFELANLPASIARVEFSAPGFRSEIVEDVKLFEDKSETLHVVLEKSEGIFGRVFEERRKEPAFPAFVIYPGQKGVSRTDETGAFSWSDAPEDVDQVQAVSPFHSLSKPQAAVRGREMEFELKPGGFVRARIVDSSGAPVTDFTIVVETFEVDGPRPYSSRIFEPLRVSHSIGTFRYGPLRPGKYDFRVRSAGLADGTSERVTVRSGATTLGGKIVLESGATIRGQIADESGAPIAGALVEEFDPMSPLRTQQTRSGADGAYELDGLTPGRRSLRVRRKGFLTSVAAGIEVPAGQEVTRDITLSTKKPGESFTFAGIGAALQKTDEGVRVQKLFEGQPAEIFGLQKGDLIVAVDGERTNEMRFDKVIEMIRGERGVAVDLEIERADGRLKMEVERGKIVVKEE